MMGGYRPIGPGSGGVSAGRAVATANLNYYISTLGSDSNPGTLALPFATLQRAMNVISATVDGAGFPAIVNIGAGSFAGVGCKPTIGLGNLFFKGAGSGSTTITQGPNDGEFNFGENFTVSTKVGAQVSINALTMQIADGFGGVATYVAGADVFLGDPISNGGPDLIFDVSGHTSGNTLPLNPTNPGSLISTDNFGSIKLNVGSGATINAFVIAQDDSAFQTLAQFNLTGSGTLVISGNFSAGFATASTGSRIQTRFTWSLGSVTVTGPRFSSITGGEIFGDLGVGTLGPNYWPGSTAGFTDAASSYDGIPGSNYNYQAPVTGFTITMNNQDTDLILDPAGTLAAGTVKMAAAAIDGQKVTIKTSQIITSFAINGNGAAVAGYTTGTLALGQTLLAIYQAANNTWYF